MHKVSRTLLLAGVLAFGTLAAACGDKIELTQVQPFIGVQSVTVSPVSAAVPMIVRVATIHGAVGPELFVAAIERSALPTLHGENAGARVPNRAVTAITASWSSAAPEGAVLVAIISPAPLSSVETLQQIPSRPGDETARPQPAESPGTARGLAQTLTYGMAS